MNTEYRWLPHLEDAVPSAGQGKRISTYTVSLEGWRRGLKLKFYSLFEDGNKLKVRYSLSNGEKTHHFSLSMGDRVSDKAFEICDDKDLTKQYLRKGNVPVPEGKMFGLEYSTEEIIQYGLSLGFPLVVKPTDGNAGRGVFANITNEKDFREIVPYVREELEFDNIIVEKYVDGEEFRIYVIEDRVLGAMNRRPARVIGDGIHTIRELIHQKNAERRLNPHLTSRLIKIDLEIETMLENQGYDLTSIPEKDKIVYLREKSNLSTGGEAVDVTDQLTPEIEQIAIDAGKAIPGLSHYGVDMIVSDDRKEGVILEVNTRPGLGGHLFPSEGQARDFAKEIIDYYFPETKDKHRSILYFDFDSVIEAVTSRSVDEIDLLTPPSNPLFGQKYIVELHDEPVDLFRRQIRRQAIAREMHGYTEVLDDGTISIVIMTTNKKDFSIIEKTIEQSFNAEIVEKVEWNKPIPIGFETKRDERLSRNEIRQLLRDKAQLERDNERLLKRYSEIQKSRFWRITAPFRFIMHNLKLLVRALKGEKN